MDFNGSSISFRNYQNNIDRMIKKKVNLSNKYLLKKFKLMFDIRKMKSQLDNVYMNSTELKSLDDSYGRIICNVADLFEGLEFNNPVFIFGVYSYLLKNGFFSFDHRFAYKRDVYDCYPLFGVNVIEGRGVCRHISSMLTDIFNEMGFDSYNLSVILNKDASGFSKQRMVMIRENHFKSTLSDNIIKFFHYPPYNHLVTLVNSSLYGSLVFDPTNDVIFIVDENEKIKSLLDDNQSMSYGVEESFNDGINTCYLKKTNPKMLSSLLFYFSLGFDFAKEYARSFDCFYRKNRKNYSDVVYKKRVLCREFKRYLLK